MPFALHRSLAPRFSGGICLWLLALVLALGLGLPAWAAPGSPSRITDDEGRVERFDRPPQRIVTLLPSLAETVCALGHCSSVVGVDRYTQWPPELKTRPKVGGGLDPNLEQIVALRPDVVLLAASARAAERLRALGLKVLVFEPETYADTQAVTLKLGQLLAVPHAAALWQKWEAAIVQTAHNLPPSAQGLRVYFEVGPEPYAAGEASFMGEILKRLGLKNIVPVRMGTFPKLNPEFVVQANPELILVGNKSASLLTQRPGWGRIRAVQSQQICVFTSEQSDVLVRPGPRLPEAAQIIADCLRQKLVTQPTAVKTSS
jgi:iron complex transport system substrate-binding protein